MMKFVIVPMLFAFVKAGVISTELKCVTIGNIAHEKEVLIDNVPSPYQLAIDYDTNTLFFSFSARKVEMFRMVYLDLKTKDYGLVTGIHGGFANAVDVKSHTVYMGGEDGIYKYNYDTYSAASVNVKSDANIWQMFYKDGLYFTTYPDEKLFFYNEETLKEVSVLKGRVMEIGVKNDGTFVFCNSSGLFTYNKVVDKTTHIGDYIVNGISADIDGIIYFSTPTGIYYISDTDNKIEELVTLDSVYGVAIESNGNIIYASDDCIIRLKPSKQKC